MKSHGIKILLLVVGLVLGMMLTHLFPPSQNQMESDVVDGRLLDKLDLSRYIQVKVDVNPGVFPRPDNQSDLIVQAKNVSNREVIVPSEYLTGHPSYVWKIEANDARMATVKPFRREEDPAFLFRPGQTATFYSGWPNCPEIQYGKRGFSPGEYRIEMSHLTSNALDFVVANDGEIKVVLK